MLVLGVGPAFARAGVRDGARSRGSGSRRPGSRSPASCGQQLDQGSAQSPPGALLFAANPFVLLASWGRPIRSLLDGAGASLAALLAAVYLASAGPDAARRTCSWGSRWAAGR